MINEKYEKQDELLFYHVRQLQAGNIESYNEIYNLSRKYIYKIIYDIVQDYHTTEDMLQETFIKIYNNIGSLQSPEAYYVWAGRIATNLCIRHIHKYRKEVLQTATDDGEGNEQFIFDTVADDNEMFIPESVIDNKEHQRIISDVIDSLSVEQKLAVQCFYFEEMSVKEIAQAMECSEGTIKSRLNYARKSIKEAVLRIERTQGTKLYSFGALPILLLVYRKVADASIVSAAAATTGAVVSNGATAVAETGAVANGATAVAETGGVVNAVTSGTIVSATATTVKSGLSAKVVALIVAGTVATVAGLGVGAAILFGGKDKESVEESSSAIEKTTIQYDEDEKDSVASNEKDEAEEPETEVTVDYGSGTITVWVKTREQCDVMEQAAKDFLASNEAYSGYKINVEYTSTEADNIIKAGSEGPDIYTFASSASYKLKEQGLLSKLSDEYVSDIKGAYTTESIEAASLDGNIYAFPFTLDDGLCLYYDKSVITDTTNLENMIKESEAAGRYFCVPVSSGWYIDGFLIGAGCDLQDNNNDGVGQFSIEYNQAEVALGELIDIVSSPYAIAYMDFNYIDPPAFVISGNWKAQSLKESLGDNYAVAKLPQYIGSDGNTYQVSSREVYTCIGVKPQSHEGKEKVCMEFAKYLSSSDVQKGMYIADGSVPTSIEVCNDSEVQADGMVMAVLEQSKHAVRDMEMTLYYWQAIGLVCSNICTEYYTRDTIYEELLIIIEELSK